jgi:hypothetical protein
MELPVAGIYNLKVFDGFVRGPSPTAYTSPDFYEELGEADELAIHAALDPDAFGGFPNSITIQIEHSADGLLWQNKNLAPEVTATNPPGIPYDTVVGYDPGTRPGLALARLRITVTWFGGGSGSSLRCALAVYVTAREYS